MTNVRAFSARRIAAASLIAASLVGVSACSTINEQATTKSYDASDGVSASVKSGSADVSLRNLMIVANDKDKPGRILGTVVNNGTDKASVTFTVAGSPAVGTVAAAAAPNNSVQLSSNAAKVMVEKTPARPGELAEVTITANGQETTVRVPVLDGTLPQYRAYIPGGASPVPTETKATAPAAGH